MGKGIDENFQFKNPEGETPRMAFITGKAGRGISGSRVAIAGGGPAGAFFAVVLLRMAKQARKHIRVTIIDRQTAGPMGRRIAKPAMPGPVCEAVIWPGAYQRLMENGIFLPEEMICKNIEHVWIHGCWKNFPFKVPAHQKLVTLHRETPKSGNGAQPLDFKAYLLQTALAHGAVLKVGEVRTIRYGRVGKPVLTAREPSGNAFETTADFAAIAAGVGDDGRGNRCFQPLFRSYQQIQPRFAPAKLRRVLIFDLETGRDYIRKYMNRELYLILSGCQNPTLEEISLIPRYDRLTVVITGKSIDRASSTADMRTTIQDFLSLNQVQTILPHLAERPFCPTGLSLALKPAGIARMPCGDRIAWIGNGLGAPDGRDGLDSALITAKALAETLIEEGLDRPHLSKVYGGVVKSLASEAFYDRLLYRLLRPALRHRLSARVLYQAFATEMKMQPMDQWPLGRLLWGLASGTVHGRDACFDGLRPPVLRSLLTGARKSVRNILTERFFGIRWQSHGRYPTVILKEKRDYFKRTLEASSGIRLHPSPDVERMYAVKIRAAAHAVFTALGTFGNVDGKMLKLRFVDVRRISGRPNQVGSRVRYRLRHLPVTMDLRLVQVVPDRYLLYQVQEVFADQGQLLFDIRPTGNGNHRLVVYTAFDFKRGKSGMGRIFWRLFRRLFPEYAHDVVWNHALCRIKGDAEAAAEHRSGLSDRATIRPEGLEDGESEYPVFPYR